MSPNDHNLLREYLGGSNEAFAELVRRHLDLVWAAARRQTRSQVQAEEVTQSVFIHLARDAGRIAPGTPLPAWLHLVTRHTAMDAVKMETRRQAREHAAFEISAMNSSSPDWTRIEPFLDEAVAALAPTDRAAVLLRYFEGRSLREVGEGLGISEDAARKRLGRALEQLRSGLLRRGVAVTAASLATNLPAQAIQAAPAGLGATIASIASLCGTALQPPIVAAATTFAMTTLQKTLTAAVLAAFVGAGLYEARVLQLQSREVRALEQRAAELGDQQQKARREREEALARAKALEAAAAQAALAASVAPSVRPAGPFSSLSLEEKMRRLRELFEGRPGSKIPEIGLLTEADWIRETERIKDLETEEQIRAALAALRSAAKMKFAGSLTEAVRNYRESSGNAQPAELAQLADYFKQPIDRAIVDRYSTNPADFNAFTFRNVIVTEKLSTISDPEYDNMIQLIPFPGSPSGMATAMSSAKNATDPLMIASKRFTDDAGGPGRIPTSAEQLVPYLPSPVPLDEVQRYVDKLQQNRAIQSSPMSRGIGGPPPASPGK